MSPEAGLEECSDQHTRQRGKEPVYITRPINNSQPGGTSLLPGAILPVTSPAGFRGEGKEGGCKFCPGLFSIVSYFLAAQKTETVQSNHPPAGPRLNVQVGLSNSGLSSQDRPQGIPPGPGRVPEADSFASAPKSKPLICSLTQLR